MNRFRCSNHISISISNKFSIYYHNSGPSTTKIPITSRSWPTGIQWSPFECSNEAALYFLQEQQQRYQQKNFHYKQIIKVFENWPHLKLPSFFSLYYKRPTVTSWITSRTAHPYLLLDAMVSRGITPMMGPVTIVRGGWVSSLKGKNQESISRRWSRHLKALSIKLCRPLVVRGEKGGLLEGWDPRREITFWLGVIVQIAYKIFRLKISKMTGKHWRGCTLKPWNSWRNISADIRHPKCQLYLLSISWQNNSVPCGLNLKLKVIIPLI